MCPPAAGPQPVRSVYRFASVDSRPSTRVRRPAPLDPVARTSHDSGMTTSIQEQRPESRAALLFADVPDEFATTRRLLERYPDGKGEWRPDPKSRTLGQLATHVADLSGLGAAVLETDRLDVSQESRGPRLDSAQALLERFDDGVARVAADLQSVSDESLEQPWALVFNGHPVLSGTRRSVLRRLLVSHMIHHRAQLATYYRALGIPVPSIYGPSADEQ